MMTIDESTIVTQPTLESSEDDTVRTGTQAWQLAIVTDRAGHVHLGALVAGPAGGPDTYIDLLAPVGADSLGESDLEHRIVLDGGQELGELRRLAECCIDDARLRQQLAQFVEWAAS